MRFKKAIVTGGAGFIGSNLVEALLKEGVHVISVDNYQSGKEENLAEFEENPLLTIVNADVTDYEAMKNLFVDVDVVFHNAASKKTICLNDPRRDLEINAKGTFNLLELSRDTGVKKFVHASTGSVYGEAVKFPQTEDHPLVPSSYYGVSKLAGEKYVKVFNKLYGLDTTVLRYFHVYGPKQDYSDAGGVISIFTNKILRGEPITIFGDGKQQRSFTYVGDVVAANLFVAENSAASGEVYNCASGINVTVNEMAETLMDKIGKVVNIKQGEPLVGDIWVFDISNKKLQDLGFSFKTSFSEGIDKTIGHMKKLVDDVQG